MPQLARIISPKGFSLNLRCPYQASVMNVFEIMSKIIVFIWRLRLSCGPAQTGPHSVCQFMAEPEAEDHQHPAAPRRLRQGHRSASVAGQRRQWLWLAGTVRTDFQCHNR